LQEAAVLDVERHDLVNLARGDAPAAKGHLDNVGLTAQLGEINPA
jgi:hypothetical protein